jgi:excisionase family DNA binding protein
MLKPLNDDKSSSVEKKSRRVKHLLIPDLPLLTVDELAAALKVPVSWIYSRTRETGSGCLPRVRVGKYIRFEQEKVAEWLREQNDI